MPSINQHASTIVPNSETIAYPDNRRGSIISNYENSSAYNNNLVDALTISKYLRVDESMCQELGKDMLF